MESQLELTRPGAMSFREPPGRQPQAGPGDRGGSVPLNGRWALRYGPQDALAPESPAALQRSQWPTVEATVPGNVELDLIAAGKLPELYRGHRIYQLRPYETYRWWYQRRFPTPRVPPGHRVFLQFDGLDCLGTIFLNDHRIGSTDNMFIGHSFEVTDILRSDRENELFVRIDSAVLAGREHQPAPGEFSFGGNWESLSIRKAPHMYGWDIMPRVVSAGLWRQVHLLIVPPTRWRSVYWATLAVDVARRTARLLVDWDFTTEQANLDGWRVRIRLSRDGQSQHGSEHAVLSHHGRAILDIQNAELWWPRGYGPAALYSARIELLDSGGAIQAVHEQKIGLRTAQLQRTDILSPGGAGEFVFVVNGEKIFAKGTNWVPLDAFHSRDGRHLDATFQMLVDLNCNMVRCWGGNVYEDHAFFDLCDRHGVMVWQDFALACAIYPQTDGFAARIRAEAEAVVLQLRSHPSLVLWAGNNEIDEAYTWARPSQDPNTDRISRQVLLEVVRRLDPVRAYLPSSPYRSPALVQAGNRDQLKPEDHLWGPRDDFKGAFYTSSPAHFASEIGYHGCPDRASLEQMLDPDSLWPWQDNDQWLTHAVRPLREFTDFNYRIALMAKQITVLFNRAPETLERFILASQISQAEALKFFIERFRQAKFDRTGILWWNLRDGWPIISDGVVDYFNRKKLAYDYIQRSQADVCPICAEPESGRHALVVVNDTLTAVSGRLRVDDVDTDQVLAESSCAVPANGKTVAGHMASSARPAMWRLTWSTHRYSAENYYLAGPRPFDLDQYLGWMQKLGWDAATHVAAWGGAPVPPSESGLHEKPTRLPGVVPAMR